MGGVTYSDGHPQDIVQYLEAKLILKPDRFVSVESFRDFGKLVERSAKKLEWFCQEPQRRAETGYPGNHLLRHPRLSPIQQRLHPAAAH